MAWDEHARREQARYADGAGRLPDDPEARQRQLVRMATAAGGAGLALLMRGEPAEARDWFRRSAEAYRESWASAPPESWGRLIGAVKSRLLGDDPAATVADARWALEQGPGRAKSAIGLYAAALAHLALGEDETAGGLAAALQADEAFPGAVADALAAVAARDEERYREAVQRVLESFESREAYLEDVPVADTVLVLEALAGPRGIAARPSSRLLPG